MAVMIPKWMAQSQAVPCTCPEAHGGRKSFIRKTLDGTFEFLQESFNAESFSARRGLLQSLDPRVKLISALAFVFALSLTNDIRALLAVYLLELLLSYASRVEISFFIKRVWLFVPLFTGVIALPMAFNIFMHGDPLWTVATLGPGAHLGPFALPEAIYITRQGTIAAAVFTARVAVSVSAVVLLFLTTPQQLLFKSLRAVGVPKLYVLTLEMTYRYIFLLVELIREMYVAKRARTIKYMSTREEQKWVGGRIGYSLVRSMDMSDKVHKAMISRGFNGDIKIMEEFGLKRRDYIAGVITILLSSLLVLVSQNILSI